MTAATIRATGWGWRHASRIRPAISGLDLEIEAGERVLLLGPSGAGKSTLLAGIAGVLGDREDGDETGRLLVNGQPAATTRGVAGLVLQDPQANTILSRVGDDVAFGCENLCVPPDEIWFRVRDALAAVELDLPLDHPTTALSGGERQRLALAGVLAMRPGVILLDEPTANLDPEGVTQVRDAVARVCDETGATLIVVEHRVDAWLPVVDRVLVLEPGGGVRLDGHPSDIIDVHGGVLAADGIWVPGHPPERDLPALPEPHASGAAQAPVLLSAVDLGVGRKGRIIQGPLNVTIPAGSSTVVTGPNGVGKSTLAGTLAGLLPPVAGAVEAAPDFAPLGKPHPIRWRSRELLERIGTVFQQPTHQFVAASVRDELAVGPNAAKRPAAETSKVVDRLLQALRLEHLADANPFTLSGGEQRRLSVATALATSPRVLVLDEPTFGQDRNTWIELVTQMRALMREGIAVVSVTHDENLVSVLGERRIRLERRATDADHLRDGER